MHYANSRERLRKLTPAVVLGLSALLLAGCGGGGGSSNSAATPVAPGAPAVTPQLLNEQSIIVDGGPGNGVNLLTTSVTICAPDDSASCRTIDNVLVDTGSTGLRLIASVLPATLKLPQQASENGSPLVECMQFADGFAWGPVATADLKLGGETIRGLKVQIIGDPGFPNIPADCSATGPAENTVSSFGSNGVIGIGSFLDDCGEVCAQSTFPGLYYACASTGANCVPTRAAIAVQPKNPVALLSRDNNGVLLRLPSVPPTGARSITGRMIFGIGTASNNGLGAARIYTVDPSDGTLAITTNGTTYNSSFLDSGSNGLFFPSPGTPVCNSGFYCPASPFTFSGVLQGRNGNNASFSLPIGNADAMFAANPDFEVIPALGGGTFGLSLVDLGLPFYFGRTVFTAFEKRTTPGGAGPYVAF